MKYNKLPEYHIAGAIAGAIGGYLGQKGANRAARENNELQRKAYEEAQKERAPIVAGAKNVLENRGNWLPFVNRIGQTAAGAMDTAQLYNRQAPQFAEAGREGLYLTQELASLSPEEQQALADRYRGKYDRAYERAATDINTQAGRAARDAALASGPFGALSTQASRQQADIERAALDARNRAAIEAEMGATGEMQAELARRQGLAGQLSNLGVSGLNQAAQAAQLGISAGQSGVGAGFLPFKEYGSTLGISSAPTAPTLQATPSPFASAVEGGLNTWAALNRK